MANVINVSVIANDIAIPISLNKVISIIPRTMSIIPPNNTILVKASL